MVEKIYIVAGIILNIFLEAGFQVTSYWQGSHIGNQE